MYQPAPLLFQQIASDPENATFRAQGWPPVYTARGSLALCWWGRRQDGLRSRPVSLGMMPAVGCYASGWG